MKSNSLNSHAKAKSFSLWKNFSDQCRGLIQTWKQEGFRAVIKKYGWKFFLIIFFYYLIRDLTLYVLIPLVIAKVSWPR